ncbi:MAG: metallophosphoesterase [Chitinophagaceae bacterium]|nr:metallophosphoesterase [Chitinophagaceae bacterium]
MYDIIGDIHGYCSKLKALLTKLDYTQTDGIWKHTDRKVIFVGDFIDRGPEIRETLQLVKGMVSNGQALAVMGNHEYNAIAFATQRVGGGYLRSHSAVHQKQHRATLDQFANYPDEWSLYLDWFRTLPLFLDLEQLRVVHACWDASHIEWLKSKNFVTLHDELLFASHQKGSLAYEVINDTLKGKEFNIPEKDVWFDKDGHARTTNRIKWWVDPGSNYFGEFLFNCPQALRSEIIPEDLKFNIYPKDAPPVFFGHYWLEDQFPVVQSANVICLDYSVAKNGFLVAYRWSGEELIDNKHFVFVE